MIRGRMSSSVVECGGLPFGSRSLGLAVAARYTVLYAVQGSPGRTMALRVSTPLCPERTQQEIGAGRIARSSRPVPAGTAFRREMRRRIDRPQAAGDAASAFHWNVVPVVHMRCRMTASLRATAMVAFLAPMRLPRASPQVFSALGRADRLSNTLAASNRRPRTMPSPHLEIRPA